MEPVKKTTLALLALLVAFVGSGWERIQVETKHWPSVWNILASILGALTAGLIMLNAVGLLDDFLTLF